MITSCILVGSGAIKKENHYYNTQLFYDFLVPISMDFVIKEKDKSRFAPEIYSALWNTSQKQRNHWLYLLCPTMRWHWSHQFLKTYYVTDRKRSFPFEPDSLIQGYEQSGITRISIESHWKLNRFFPPKGRKESEVLGSEQSYLHSDPHITQYIEDKQ